MAGGSGQKSSAAEQELYRRWGEVLEKDNNLATFYFSPKTMSICFNA